MINWVLASAAVIINQNTGQFVISADCRRYNGSRDGRIRVEIGRDLSKAANVWVKLQFRVIYWKEMWEMLLKKTEMREAAKNGRKKISEMIEKYVHTK